MVMAADLCNDCGTALTMTAVPQDRYAELLAAERALAAMEAEGTRRRMPI